MAPGTGGIEPFKSPKGTRRQDLHPPGSSSPGSMHTPFRNKDQQRRKEEKHLLAYGCLRGHDEMRIAEGSLEQREFTAVYRTGEHLAGVLTVGMPPKSISTWQQALAARTPWRQAVSLLEGAAA